MRLTTRPSFANRAAILDFCPLILFMPPICDENEHSEPPTGTRKV